MQWIEEVPSALLPTRGFDSCEVPPPEREIRDVEALPDAVRKARRYDFAGRDDANRKLGRAGEAFIVARERWHLLSRGRDDLCAYVEWVSDTHGDRLGYDIASFDPASSEPLHIEVKTTNCGRDSPFYVSVNEVKVSAELGARYRLYRLFNFSTVPQFFQLAGDLAVSLDLAPRLYIARRR